MKHIHPESIRLNGSIHSNIEEHNFINNLLYWNKDLPNEKRNTLESIRAQCEDIISQLQPLVDLGICFDLSLVGGSVRDFILDNSEQIKDLDIMLSFSNINGIHLPTIDQFINKTSFDLNSKNIKATLKRNNQKHFDHWKRYYEIKNNNEPEKIALKNVILFDMVICALDKENELGETYKPHIHADESKIKNKKEEDAEKYVDLRIEGVIKLKNKNWKWPVDILVTNYHLEPFLSAFDFGICKVGIELVRSNDLMEHRHVPSKVPEDLLKRVKLTSSFLNDYKNKELSMFVGELFSLKQLKHSCEIHLPKLEAKYPWKLNIQLEKSIDQDDLKQPYLDTFNFQRKLNSELKNKPGQSNFGKV